MEAAEMLKQELVAFKDKERGQEAPRREMNRNGGKRRRKLN
jgi:hypothetical protein